MSSDLQTEFIKQIKYSGKIRTLKDIYSLINLISNTPALNNKRTRISKSNLYMSITDLLVKFLEEKRIYILGKQELIYMQYICGHLPKKCLHRLRSYLLRKRKTLMCEEIDRLVRFNLYLEDKKMADIVDNILSMIQSTG